MNRQHALIWIGITFVVMFIIVLLDSATVTYNCTWNCLHIVGKFAFVIAGLCVLGIVLVGLIRKKR